MDDIVERLRTIIATPHGVDIWTTTALEAAAEIERLRFERDGHRDAARAYKDEIERLRAALLLAAGKLSTLVPYTLWHPETIYKAFLEDGEKEFRRG